VLRRQDSVPLLHGCVVVREDGTWRDHLWCAVSFVLGVVLRVGSLVGVSAPLDRHGMVPYLSNAPLSPRRPLPQFVLSLALLCQPVVGRLTQSMTLMLASDTLRRFVDVSCFRSQHR
jgi:hypothetical protein